MPRDWGAPIRAAAIEAGCMAGRCRSKLAARDGRSSTRSSCTSSWARSPAACGRTSRAPTTSLPTPIAEQRRRYLEPALRGERSGSYAITEDGAGSDARALRSTAVLDRATGEYVLNGEKWFVTGPDDTDFMIFHCLVVDGDARLPTLFLVDYDTPGLTLKHDPDYTHTFADRHPQFVLSDVRVPASAVLGGVGRADELTNDWFVEERIHIGARCTGAMERLLGLAVEWATERIQFGERIYDFQGVSFPLADSAADASAARLLTRECALARRHRGRSQGRPREGVAREAVRVGGGMALCGPCGPGVRWPRLHARVRTRALPARAARRPDLGGDLGDPADRHRASAREARRRTGGRVMQRAGSGRMSVGGHASDDDRTRRDSGTGATGGHPERRHHRPAPAVRARRASPSWAPRRLVDRRDGPRQPPDDGQRDPMPLRQPELRGAPRPAVLPVARRPPRTTGRRHRGAQSVACGIGHRGGGRGRSAGRHHPGRRRGRGWRGGRGHAGRGRRGSPASTASRSSARTAWASST